MAVGKYDTHVKPKLLLIEAWCRDGLTDADIYNNLKISHDSFYTYKKQYSEFSDALKRGKEEVDITVENALYKRAMGYSYDEITQEAVTDPKTGKGILVVTKVITKEVQPDTTAQIFWLKNRKQKEWRDKQDIEHSGNITMTIEDQLRELIES